jgi:hypothetical protein
MSRSSRDERKGEQGRRSPAASSTTSGSGRTTSSDSVAACRKEEGATKLLPCVPGVREVVGWLGEGESSGSGFKRD